VEALQDFWENIPMWVVVVAVAVLAVGLWFLFQYLGFPLWMSWMVVGGLAVGGLVAGGKALLGGGL